ncbi:MAG: bifunctional diaminohydroxyphosphoribosylaminopyrimidine deaminase/5-amino-6-(5-phosphoribosylamino)uracil reductase RibD [Akkermansiaceae bacterium]
MKSDEYWMQLAISEAQKGIGLTSPNPPVGAVIVKDNQLLGQGWHQGAGLPHAEREAIANVLANHAKSMLIGACIYVTLEPCSTHGRTPPCTQGIIDHGIQRVVYGAKDPNPDHVGRAEKILQQQGIEVNTGICEMECLALIRAFSKKQFTGLPWVILKSAISLDGKITRPPGESQWLTSVESRDHVQKIRFECDAIITGGNTLRTDNPALTIRDKKLLENSAKTQPWRMIITQSKRDSLPTDAQVFNDSFADKTLVQEHGDILEALKTLSSKGCNQVMVEAGGKLMGAFLDAGLADEVVIFYAPLLTGGDFPGFAGLSQEVKLKDSQFIQIGNDVMLRARIDHFKS